MDVRNSGHICPSVHLSTERRTEDSRGRTAAEGCHAANTNTNNGLLFVAGHGPRATSRARADMLDGHFGERQPRLQGGRLGVGAPFRRGCRGCRGCLEADVALALSLVLSPSPSPSTTSTRSPTATRARRTRMRRKENGLDL